MPHEFGERLARAEESLIVAHKCIESREEENNKMVDRVTRNENQYIPAAKMAIEAHAWVIELRNAMESFSESIENKIQAIFKNQDEMGNQNIITNQILAELKQTATLKDIEDARQRGIDETIACIAKERKATVDKYIGIFGLAGVIMIGSAVWWVYINIHEMRVAIDTDLKPHIVAIKKSKDKEEE